MIRPMRKLVLLALLVCGSARADKSPDTAKLLSGVGTGVSSALVVGGFMFAADGDAFNTPLLYSGLASSIITPSLGQWYAGDWFTPGMAVRIGAVGLATFALTHETYDVVCPLSSSAEMRMCSQLKGAGIALLGVAAIAYVGAAAYDVSDAPQAVERHNHRSGVIMAPTAMSSPQGVVPGLALAGYF